MDVNDPSSSVAGFESQLLGLSESTPTSHTDDPLAADAPNSEVARATLKLLGPPMIRLGPLNQLNNSKEANVVTQALERSPVLSARVLSLMKIANLIGADEVPSIRQAVNLMGPSRARAVCLAHGLRIATEQTALPEDIKNHLWFSALRKAACSRAVCVEVDEVCSEAGYAIGLIQDVGLPMLMTVDLDFYRELIDTVDDENEWTQYERERFGVSHAEIGYAMLKQWDAPPLLQELVLHHHDEPKSLETFDDFDVWRLSSYVAGMLPHTQEDCGDTQLSFLNSVHKRYLSSRWATSDDFIGTINASATRRYEFDGGEPELSKNKLLPSIIRDVSLSMNKAVATMCRYEASLHDERNERKRVANDAITDPLTKVLNRHGFLLIMEKRLKRGMESGQGVCCMLADLDEFKECNDTHGHEAGDKLLRGLAMLFRSCMRQGDPIGRLGGDEFAAFIAGIDQERAEQMAHKVNNRIQGRRIKVSDSVSVRLHMSLGVVYFPKCPKNLSVDQLLKEADRAMYEQKHGGKHGVSFVVLDRRLPRNDD